MAGTMIFKSAEGEKAVMDLYSQGLALWPVPFEEVTIETSYGRTFVIASGKPDAPPMVLLHGSGGNALTWQKEAAYFSENYRVYAVDILGEAGKSGPNRLSLSSKDHVLWLEEIFSGLGIEKAVVAGNSLGGWIALQFGIYAPRYIEKLVLICPAGISSGRMGIVFIMILLGLFGKPGKKLARKIVFGDQPISEEAELVVETMAKHYNYRVEQLPVFSDKELSEIAVPTLLVAGEKDMLFSSKKSAARIKALVRDAEICLLENQGHGLFNLENYIEPFLLR